MYLQRQYSEAKSRRLYVNIANEKAKLKNLKALLKVKRVYLISNEKLNKGKENQPYTLEYELNIRATMALFYIGNDGFDIGEILGMFGLLGGKGWERQFNR